MTVQPATATSASTASGAAALATLQAGTAAKKDEATEGSDRFLKLLVTQLKNQDPLNPMDNAQVTTQMAQINTVAGINKLNETMSTLALGYNAGQSLQAASMVGRQVLAEGNALQLGQGGSQGGYVIEAAAEALTLTVKSASGAVVYSADLGKQPAGMHMFSWDGTASNGQQAAPGAYTFEVAARNGKDSSAAQTLMLGRVDGVTPAASGAKLSLGGLGDVSIVNVKHIL